MQNFILLISLVLTQVMGDIWLSRAMKDFGNADPFNLQGFKTLIIYLLTNAYIWTGVGCLIFSLFLYFIAVSRLDLSYVLPIHATNYVFNAILAWLILGEKVSTIRYLSAFIICIGAAIVSISQHPDSYKNILVTANNHYLRFRKKWFDRFFLSLTPVAISGAHFWLMILLTVSADATGDLFNVIGMRKIGETKLDSVGAVFGLLKKIITNSYIIRGIALQASALIAFVTILSWADISLVRPATALTYIFSLIGAKFLLKEEISRLRFVGIIFVGAGVALIGLD